MESFSSFFVLIDDIRINISKGSGHLKDMFQKFIDHISESTNFVHAYPELNLSKIKDELRLLLASLNKNLVEERNAIQSSDEIGREFRRINDSALKVIKDLDDELISVCP